DGLDGFAVLQQIRCRFPEVEVIMCTADAKPSQAVRAMKLGAFDYLTKDFGEFAHAAETIATALQQQGAQRELIVQHSDALRALDGGMVVGGSPRMSQRVGLVARV